VPQEQLLLLSLVLACFLQLVVAVEPLPQRVAQVALPVLHWWSNLAQVALAAQFQPVELTASNWWSNLVLTAQFELAALAALHESSMYSQAALAVFAMCSSYYSQVAQRPLHASDDSVVVPVVSAMCNTSHAQY
jgi:hypothetical protein